MWFDRGSEYISQLDEEEEYRLTNFFLAKLLASSAVVSSELVASCMNRLPEESHALMTSENGMCSRSDIARELRKYSISPCLSRSFSSVQKFLSLTDAATELLCFLFLSDYDYYKESKHESLHCPMFVEFQKVNDRGSCICSFLAPIFSQGFCIVDKTIEELEQLSLITCIEDAGDPDDDTWRLPIFFVAFWLKYFLIEIWNSHSRILSVNRIRSEFPYPYDAFVLQVPVLDEQFRSLLGLVQECCSPVSIRYAALTLDSAVAAACRYFQEKQISCICINMDLEPRLYSAGILFLFCLARQTKSVVILVWRLYDTIHGGAFDKCLVTYAEIAKRYEVPVIVCEGDITTKRRRK